MVPKAPIPDAPSCGSTMPFVEPLKAPTRIELVLGSGSVGATMRRGVRAALVTRADADIVTRGTDV